MTGANIAAGTIADRFPVGAVVKIGRGIIPWTVTRVTDHDIHLTANHVTSRTMPHHEALARLRVVA